MEGNVKRKTVLGIDEVSRLLRDSGIGATNGKINFPNAILRNYARLNKPLPFGVAYAVGMFAIYPMYESLSKDADLASIFGDPNLAKTQSVALLSSIYNRGTMSAAGSEDMLAGIIAAIFDYDINNSSQGILRFTSPKIICDNCGTGGDNINTFHISTTAAVLIATYGVTNDLAIVKHGSPGNAQKSGSSDFVASLGVEIMPQDLEYVRKLARETGFGFIEALDTRFKSIHTQTHSFAQLAHMNDIIGPMTSPVDPQQLQIKLLGVNQVVDPLTVARAYKVLNGLGVTNVRRGLFVRGLVDSKDSTVTMDEISILVNGGTEAVLLENQSVTDLGVLTSSDFGVRPAKLVEVMPKTNDKQGRIDYSLDVLHDNAPEGAVNTLLANAGAVIALSLDNVDLLKGTEIARALFGSKEHLQTLRRLRQ